jgi:hypothetical protein
MVEGQTVFTVGIPFAIVVLTDWAVSFFSSQSRSGSNKRCAIASTPQVVAPYFRRVALVSLVLLLGWGWRWDWHWPEFRVVGWGPFSQWPGMALQSLRYQLTEKHSIL